MNLFKYLDYIKIVYCEKKKINNKEIRVICFTFVSKADLQVICFAFVCVNAEKLIP